MGKRENRSHGFGLLLIGILIAVGSLTALAAASITSSPHSKGAPSEGRTDLVVIDVLKQFGPLQRPPVAFQHDNHTRALAEQNKDCLSCHQKGEKRLSLMFKRLDNPDAKSVMDLYHANCIGCHADTREAGLKSGPETCGQCHSTDPLPADNRTDIQLDKYLHFRHSKAMTDQCAQCHHLFDEDKKALVYIKGEEGACLYCHREKTEGNRISNREASHIQCIECHREKTAQELAAGPMECSGCHAKENRQLYEKPEDLERMKRNQPDTVFVKGRKPITPDVDPMQGLGPVAFNHQGHETYNDSCRVCHHADLGTCARCHSSEGTPDGNQIKLTQAMHYQNSESSCIGCHTKVQQRSECIGCHRTVKADPALAPQEGCMVCHRILPEGETMPADETMAQALAARQLSRRPAMEALPSVDDIPDKVTIKFLEKEYEAVVMPHRKMVLALADGVRNNPLAEQFHTTSATLCQGCHHNAPETTKPAQCISCHGRSSDNLNPGRPGLLAAYHQQCIDCHEYMGIEKPKSRECTACHAQREATK